MWKTTKAKVVATKTLELLTEIKKNNAWVNELKWFKTISVEQLQLN